MQFSEVSENTENKIHNTAITSREAFIDLTNKGRLIDEKKLIFEAIRSHGPVTSRRLTELTRRERGNVCRSLYDLLNEVNPQIKVAYIERCPVTKRRVKWYAVIEWKPPTMVQGSLLQEAAA